MKNRRVVVDGSNLATEGRSTPSLSQLDDAVRAFLEEFPDARITVVVDATFGHRIHASEKQAYEEGVLAGELVSPPAGAIGRGDAFVLQIANRADAVVLSNDSFQEFHGEYDWLFEEGRLIGGKPVPDVGWIFVLRAPVRGPTSRRVTRSTRSAKKKAAQRPPTKAASKASRRKVGASPAPAEVAPNPPSSDDDDRSESDGGRGRRRRSGSKNQEPVNEPVPFLEFVSAHPVGSTVIATVDRFSSHGAYATVGPAHCYVPLKSMGEPPPKSAREVLTVGVERDFVVQGFDTPRRSIDLAIPGFAQIDEGDQPSIEPEAAALAPVPEQPAEEAPKMAPAKKAPTRRAPAKKAKSATSSTAAEAKKAATAAAREAGRTVKKAAAGARATVETAAAGARSTAKKASTGAKATGTSAKRSRAGVKGGKATAKKTAAKKRAGAKGGRATAKKTAAKKRAAAKGGRATAKKTAAKKSTARKSAAKKSTAKKSAGAKKATAARKATKKR